MENIREYIWNRDNRRCIYCGKKLRLDEMWIEHKIPRVFGGTSEESNLLCSCKDCNLEKSSKIVLRERDLIDISEQKKEIKEIEKNFNLADTELWVYQKAIDVITSYNQNGVEDAIKRVDDLREFLVEIRRKYF